MDRRLIDPPALVKNVDVRAELAPKIRATFRRTQEDRRQLGEWLIQCKEACLRAGDDWLAWLERETGIPPRTAQSWMEEAKNKGHDKSTMRNIAHDPPGESQTPIGETPTDPTMPGCARESPSPPSDSAEESSAQPSPAPPCEEPAEETLEPTDSSEDNASPPANSGSSAAWSRSSPPHTDSEEEETVESSDIQPPEEINVRAFLGGQFFDDLCDVADKGTLYDLEDMIALLKSYTVELENRLKRRKQEA